MIMVLDICMMPQKEAPMTNAKISDYMSRSPHTIGQEQTLEMAHALMREHSIQHLPVLHGGQLVGTVSLRDLDLTEGFDGVDPGRVKVEEAMSTEPHAVTPDTSLKEVVNYLVDQGFGSAIVMEGREVVGVFTANDAMRALRDKLNE
jgi:acetoin utilization protein AcuB